MDIKHLIACLVLFSGCLTLNAAESAAPETQNPTPPSQTENTPAAPKAKDEIIRPKLKQTHVALYPLEMLTDKKEGEVLLEVVVNKDGGVRDAIVMTSSDEKFNANAISAVKKFEFTPGMKNGNVATFHIPMLIQFVLKGAVIDVRSATKQPKLTYEPPRKAVENKLDFSDREAHEIQFEYVISKEGVITSLNFSPGTDISSDLVQYYLSQFSQRRFTPATYNGEPVAVICRGMVTVSGSVTWR